MRHALLFALLISGISTSTLGQVDFPTKTIRFVVGFAAGGQTDVLARLLAQEAKRLQGWDIVVVNKLGAGGALSTLDVINSAPDGHTLGVIASPTLTTAALMQKDIPPDLLERTSALVSMGRVRNAITVKAESSFRTFKDMIENARKNPGKLSIGVSGVGTKSLLVLQLIAQQEKVDITFVPYQGEAGSFTALLGGHVSAAALTAATMGRPVQARSMRIVSSMDEDRFDIEPDAPTLMEQGWPYSSAFSFYVYGPRGLSAAVTRKLIDVFATAVSSPAYVELATKSAVDLKKPLTGEALDRYFLAERAQTKAMIDRQSDSQK